MSVYSSSVASLTNPYKFSVYRTAAMNSAVTPAPLLFDTKDFDTGSNVDIVTNKGRFTAPIAGFYQFNVHCQLGAAYTYFIATLYKNSAANGYLFDLRASAAQGGASGGKLISLAAGDFVEVYIESNATIALNVAASTRNYFTGFLVSPL